MVPEVYAQNKNEKKMQIGICIVKSDVGGKQQTGIAFCGKGGNFLFYVSDKGLDCQAISNSFSPV